MQQLEAVRASMTFDEVSMERSKNFMKALQELKILRPQGPQLYSAAEYCEKSYVHNEQKQMVLDNLKDYTVRALVNAVDHLETVAYKLTDLFEQQTLDISTLDLKVTCLDQISMKTIEAGAASPKYILEKTRPYGLGTPPPRTLCWHLATETKSGLNDASNASISSEDTIASTVTPGVFCLSDVEAAVSSVPTLPCLDPSANAGLHSNTKPTALAAAHLNKHESARTLAAYKSFGHGAQYEAARPPMRSKTVLSALFGKK